HPLPEPFQVFATRNPIEQEGTYPLPEAQLDRFLLEIHVDYPSEEEERQIARRTTSGQRTQIEAVVDHTDVQAFGELVPQVPATDEAVSLAVALARASRPDSSMASAEVKQYVRFGAGPRGTQALVLASKGRAVLRGDPVVDVEDVLAMAAPALRHRLVLSYRAEADSVSSLDLVERIVREQRSRLKI
ncbi:MAG: MoxR family ATPase, partial [Polyangiaceae bacterium]